jgi:hypothetical protein
MRPSYEQMTGPFLAPSFFAFPKLVQASAALNLHPLDFMSLLEGEQRASALLSTLSSPLFFNYLHRQLDSHCKIAILPQLLPCGRYKFQNY